MSGTLIDKKMAEKAGERRRTGSANHLLTEWDPIGTEHVSACADEYDSYIGGAIGLLIVRVDRLLQAAREGEHAHNTSARQP